MKECIRCKAKIEKITRKNNKTIVLRDIGEYEGWLCIFCSAIEDINKEYDDSKFIIKENILI